MKIIKDNKVYVQYCDITHLMEALAGLKISCPNSIIEKCFSNGFICIQDNRFDFIEFEGLEAVEFFRNLDYIIDYEKVKDLSEDELTQLGSDINKKINKIVEEYNSMSEKDKNNNYERAITECNLLKYKMISVRDFLWFKQKHIEMKLPTQKTSKIPKQNKIKILIKNLFRKK